jgi:ribosome maturation factor RimP
MQQAESAIARLVRSVVEPMGYELVGVQYLQRGAAGSLLRVYIDQEKGITLDDCTAVSHQVSGVLDVEDPLPGHYDLEVSSPGLDRPLFEAAHYARFCGHRARIKLRGKVEGRRAFEGLIEGVEGEQVALLVDGERRTFELGAIESGRLVPEF